MSAQAEVLMSAAATESGQAEPVALAGTEVAVPTAARSGLLYARRDASPGVVASPVVNPPPLPDPSVQVPVVALTDDSESTSIQVSWTMYKLTGSAGARERLILHYSPLVSAVAARLGMRLPTTVERADLVSYGMFGLIDAIDKFALDREIKFETYAQARIRGAILDGLRAADWIPRSVRSKARNLSHALNELEAQFHRTPTRAELAEHMQLTVAEIHQIEIQHASGSVMALDEMLAGGDRVEQSMAASGIGQDWHRDPADAFEDKELKQTLANSIALLGARDRLMLVLYYFERLTLSEIGCVLGVTESRVSQMHSGAMRQLQESLRSTLAR